ncbi:MAG: hypothetical protein ACE5R6_02995 [Candidatus Heimdallarchaeota archaeon]
MVIGDSTDSPPTWARGNITRYITKRWKTLGGVIGSHGVFGALFGLIYGGEVGELLCGAPLAYLGITVFN